MARIVTDARRLSSKEDPAVKRLRSTILTAAICLALGAAVSYGVAWGIYHDFGRTEPFHSMFKPLPQLSPMSATEWPIPLAGWPSAKDLASQSIQTEISISRSGDWGREEYSYGCVLISNMTSYGVREYRYGWPLSCVAMYWVKREEAHAYVGSRPDSRWFYGGLNPEQAMGLQAGSLGRFASPLPVRPLWTGLFLNALLVGLPLFCFLQWYFVMRRGWRDRANLCPACRYPRGTSPVCTECGEAFRVAGGNA
jgi:hypothetical protein